MNPGEARESLVTYWMASADEALASARSEQAACRLRFAMNRAYYACFYAASALFMHDGKKYVKHAGLRSAVHRELVHSRRISLELGQAYDSLFDARQQADYAEVAQFATAEVEHALSRATSFVAEMKRLLATA